MLQGPICNNDVPKIAELQHRLVQHTTALRDDAIAMTILFQIVFEQTVPLEMRTEAEALLKQDPHYQSYIAHKSLVTAQRGNDREDTRVRRQVKVMTILDDGEFTQVAVKYGWFDKGSRFWQYFLKLVKIHTDWSELLKLLRKQFFNTHCTTNDWVALAKKPVHEYITASDIQNLAQDGVSLELSDPFEQDFLRHHYSLEFDEFGFVDPVKCGQAILQVIGKDISEWRKQHVSQELPQFPDRVRILAASLNGSDTVTAGSTRDQLESTATSQSAIVEVQKTASSTTKATTNTTARTCKRKRGVEKRIPRMPKRTKHGDHAASNYEELQTGEQEDEDVETGDEERDPSSSANINDPRAERLPGHLEYMSRLEKENYNKSCREVAAAFKNTLQFIDTWIEKASNLRNGLSELDQHLTSFKNLKPLVSEGGYRLAAEWALQGSLTQEVFEQASEARASADIWSLTTTQACELMELGRHIQKPLIVRSNEHHFSLTNFLSQLEHKFTLEGTLSVQGGTADNSRDTVSDMKILEVLQRLEVQPRLEDPLSFTPLNCLDIAAFWPWTSVPAAMQHRRFSVVSAMQSRIVRKRTNTTSKPGKQSITKPNSVQSSVRTVDMESCTAFMLLASALAFSSWHEDLLNNTWLQCLCGRKAWFMRIGEGDTLPTVVILEPGDWLLMPAGLRVRHAVLTVEGPSVMVGGQHLDGHFLLPQLEQIRSLIEHPERTNESVPALQLLIIIDNIIEHLNERPNDTRIFKIASGTDNTPSLVEGLQEWRDKAKKAFGCE
ncbi:hypothetical protein KCU77_g2557, partial [Aureobasidium melanogenum]